MNDPAIRIVDDIGRASSAAFFFVAEACNRYSKQRNTPRESQMLIPAVYAGTRAALIGKGALIQLKSHVVLAQFDDVHDQLGQGWHAFHFSEFQAAPSATETQKARLAQFKTLNERMVANVKRFCH